MDCRIGLKFMTEARVARMRGEGGREWMAVLGPIKEVSQFRKRH